MKSALLSIPSALSRSIRFLPIPTPSETFISICFYPQCAARGAKPLHLTSYHDLRYTILTDSLAGPVCSVCGISNSFPSLCRQSRQFRGTNYIGPRDIIALYPDRFRGAGSFHQLVQRRASSARGRLIPAPSFIIQIHLAPRAP